MCLLFLRHSERGKDGSLVVGNHCGEVGPFRSWALVEMSRRMGREGKSKKSRLDAFKMWISSTAYFVTGVVLDCKVLSYAECRGRGYSIAELELGRRYGRRREESKWSAGYSKAGRRGEGMGASGRDRVHTAGRPGRWISKLK